MKIKNLFYKLRHIIAIGLIVAVSLVCFVWVYKDSVVESVGKWQRTILNDDYSTLTEAVTDEVGAVQHIYVLGNTDFYGVNLNIHTFGRQNQGKIFVDVTDMDGNVLATAKDDLANVYNDNFHRFMFEDNVNLRSREMENYKLHIYIEPETEQDAIALWKSAERQGMQLNMEPVYVNGKMSSGVLAVQQITEYTTGEALPYFKILAAFMLVFLVASYVIIFVLKAKIHIVFACMALMLGGIFSIFTPVNGAPDEYIHIGMSYHLSNQILGIENSYDDGQLTVRNCDYGDGMIYESADYNVFDIKDMYNGLTNDTVDDGQFTKVWTKWSEGYFPPLYWAQALGITLARIVGVGWIHLVVMGRLANLAMYVVMTFFAIKRMPFFKNVIAVVALTPIPLQIAASYTYDTLVMGLCFLFTATVLDIAYRQQKVHRRDYLLLVLLAVFIAPSKAVYVVIVGLCLIIPAEKFGGVKKAALSIAVVFAAAATMWLAYNQTFIGMVKDSLFPQAAVETVTEEAEDAADVQPASAETVEGEGVQTAEQQEIVEIVQVEQTITDEAAVQAAEPTPTPAPKDDLLENGDSRYLFTAGYILTHISDTVKLIFNTIEENTVLYIYQLFGGILGEVILSPLHVNWLYVIVVMFVVFLSTISPSGETLQYKGVKKWWGLAIALCISALLCIACITWTPVNYSLVFGIQGRYFIPVLPLILLFITNENVTIKKNIDRYLLFVLGVADILIILDGFVMMVTNRAVI